MTAGIVGFTAGSGTGGEWRHSTGHPCFCAQRQRAVDFLFGVLLHRPHGNHGAGADVERRGFEIHLARDLASAFDLLFCPEIVPDAARKIERTGSRSLLDHRRYQGELTHASRPGLEAESRKRIAFFVVPERTVTWDHRKLGAPDSG